jgi:Domain of unknown function DUF29
MADDKPRGAIIPYIQARADTGGQQRVAYHDYNTDFAQWAEDQARALRAAAGNGSNLQIDWENVAEEIEALARSERSSLASHIATVIEHLAKLDASPATDPRAGWQETIFRSREKIQRLLDDNPSMRANLDEVIEKEHLAAMRVVGRLLALHAETPLVPLDRLCYSKEQVLDDWWPAAPSD